MAGGVGLAGIFAMQTAASNDTYSTLLQKLFANTSGYLTSETLIPTLLAYILDAQGGPFQPSNSGDTEYRLWVYILQNQCGPWTWAQNDQLDTVLLKVLMNMGAPNPGSVTKVTLVKLMVNLGAPLTNCYTSTNNIVLISGGNMLTISGNNLVLI